jgi:hypothetical protein
LNQKCNCRRHLGRMALAMKRPNSGG